MALTIRDSIQCGLREAGYVRLHAVETFSFLGPLEAESWLQFAGSWNDLGPDLYMADGGRYRRRRHATFQVVGGQASPKPHQPHFQSRDYNPLNGVIQRWFEPVSEEIADGPVTHAILRQCGLLFTGVSGRPPDSPWHVELHQFRIEATRGAAGRPTPEGRHRDGVDWVFVMLVGRRNVTDGVTEVGAARGQALGRFTLAAPGDAVLLDDRRVWHDVTAITPVDDALPAYRDALVVTFRAEPSGDNG